tara:strand:- start:25095 stop:25217 length:123 start_codon:yes stop_codon:yes gene_type:complete
MPTSTYFLYIIIFVAGVVIGRLTMAIQYSLMKKHAKDKKS